MFGPMAMKEELEGDLTLVAARQVLREAWLPEEGTSEWLDQARLPSPASCMQIYTQIFSLIDAM